MAVGDYGYHEINGQEVAADPDVTRLTLGKGDDTLGLTTYIYVFRGLPLLRVFTGDGDDTVTGGPATIFAGGGNDSFAMQGTDGDQNNYGAPNTVWGQAGDDHFADGSGSSVFKGGIGNDSWTNVQVFGAQALDGDVDYADLGSGADRAFVNFDISSDPDTGATIWQDRTISLDGGKGRDTLTLFQANASLELFSDDRLDLR
ncbi:MAG: hypothetical protein AAF761_10950, partial [Pseudomonadota bacterium]